MMVGGYRATFIIADMQRMDGDERWTIFSPYMEKALAALHIGVVPIEGFQDWTAIKVSEKLLTEPGHDDFAALVASDIFNANVDAHSEFDKRNRMSEFIAPLFAGYRDLAWEIFSRALDRTEPSQQFWLLMSL